MYNFRKVIHRATYWINAWSHLLPENRVRMNSGCTRLMRFVHAIFNVVGDILIKYKMHRIIIYFIFRWLIHVTTYEIVSQESPI
jgi:hypothetical protein